MVYVGNDVNIWLYDFSSVAVSPSDAHPLILRVRLALFPRREEGFVHAFIEDFIGLSNMSEENLISFHTQLERPI